MPGVTATGRIPATILSALRVVYGQMADQISGIRIIQVSMATTVAAEAVAARTADGVTAEATAAVIVVAVMAAAEIDNLFTS